MIEAITLTNFRNYGHHQFKFHPAVTLIIGPNATGKTNLLEAVYVLATTKSFRAKDPELIKHGQPFFRIEATSKNNLVGLGYQAVPAAKKIDYNQVKKPLFKHFGNFPIVLFEPNDLWLLLGPPSGRRRYLDGLLSQTDQSYLKALSRYQKILKQRNALLEKFDIGAVRDQVFAWDLNLTEAAAEIVKARQELIAYFNQELPIIYQDIAGAPATIVLNYLPTVEANGSYGEAFLNRLTTNLPADLAAGFTTIGPHREDFGLMFNQATAGSVASRGEIRSLILALKLAELGRLTSEKAPILLLDDVFSELDKSRRNYLISKLGQYQTIITTTNADMSNQIDLDQSLIETSKLSGYAVN